jgi:hypothetical protein
LREERVGDRQPSGHRKTEARRRTRLRLEIALLVLSAAVVGGILYYDTTGVADGFYGLHLRAGRIVGVQEGGHIYRIPILDHVVQIDKGTRPLPALRRTAKSAQGSPVSYEALLTFRVVDAARFWTGLNGADDAAARLVGKTAETAIAAAIAGRDDAGLAAPDAMARLGAAVTAAIGKTLAESGLAVDPVRFVSLRVAQ